MKKNLSLVFMLLCIIMCDAQTIENPVFDRKDVEGFRVDKVEITNDTTFLYCSYNAVAGSWANISKNTYLQDVNTKQKYPLLKCDGLPYSPNKKEFIYDEHCEIRLCFNNIRETRKFDLIETPDKMAFNVYGLNVDTIHYNRSYKDYEVWRLMKQREFYADHGNLERAISFSKDIVEGMKFMYGLKSEALYMAISNLAFDYHSIGRNMNAIECLNDALIIAKSLPNEKLKTIDLLKAFSVYYNDLGNYQKAIDYIRKCNELIKIIYGEESMEYANTLIILSNYSNNAGDYSNGILYAEQAADLIKNEMGEQNDLYVRSLSNYATARSNIGDYEDAIKFNVEAHNINTKLYDAYNVDNAIFLGNISYNYAALGKYKEAIKYGEEACSLYRINNMEDQSFVTFLNNISNYYLELAAIENGKNQIYNDYLNKFIINSDSAELVAHHFNEKENILPLIKNNKAYRYGMQGNYDMSIKLLKEACSLCPDKSTMEYATYLENLGMSYILNGDIKDAVETMKMTYPIVNDRIKKTLKSLTVFDISNYWQTLDSWYNNYIPKCAYYSNDSLAISLLYNETALFAKGFLLNANLHIKNIIYDEGNDENISCLNLLDKLYEDIDNLPPIFNHEDSVNYDRIKKEILVKEKKLAHSSMVYKYFLQQINCDWKDIRGCLKEKEIAIEFVRCPMGLFNDSLLYIALIIKKDSNLPKMIPMFYENDLFNSMSLSNIYNFVWKKLEGELQGMSSVFFSPIGELSNLGIEYSTNNKGEIFTSLFNVYRLSSTRELLYRNKLQCNYRNAVLFGGLDYDADNKDSDKKDPDNRLSERLDRGMIELLVERGGFDRLDNTLVEVHMIDSILNNKIHCDIYSAERGSEDNFKKLSSREFQILHMSTHGAYINSDDTDRMMKNNNFSFIRTDNNNFNYERNALTRSFLVMSGGNRLSKRLLMSDSMDDGILTALEISYLNLRNVDMTILSACQTGLGDVNNEGVLGLQRGFKKAGVNTILMSLNKVDDEATKILMVEFYRNLMNGKSKHQSLKESQNHLRQVDNGKYNKPEYWASFIMLDGLN